MSFLKGNYKILKIVGVLLLFSSVFCQCEINAQEAPIPHLEHFSLKISDSLIANGDESHTKKIVETNKEPDSDSSEEINSEPKFYTFTISNPSDKNFHFTSIQIDNKNISKTPLELLPQKPVLGPNESQTFTLSLEQPIGEAFLGVTVVVVGFYQGGANTVPVRNELPLTLRNPALFGLACSHIPQNNLMATLKDLQAPHKGEVICTNVHPIPITAHIVIRNTTNFILFDEGEMGDGKKIKITSSNEKINVPALGTFKFWVQYKPLQSIGEVETHISVIAEDPNGKYTIEPVTIPLHGKTVQSYALLNISRHVPQYFNQQSDSDISIDGNKGAINFRVEHEDDVKEARARVSLMHIAPYRLNNLAYTITGVDPLGFKVRKDGSAFYITVDTTTLNNKSARLNITALVEKDGGSQPIAVEWTIELELKIGSLIQKKGPISLGYVPRNQPIKLNLEGLPATKNCFSASLTVGGKILPTEQVEIKPNHIFTSKQLQQWDGTFVLVFKKAGPLELRDASFAILEEPTCNLDHITNNNASDYRNRTLSDKDKHNWLNIYDWSPVTAQVSEHIIDAPYAIPKTLSPGEVVSFPLPQPKNKTDLNNLWFPKSYNAYVANSNAAFLTVTPYQTRTNGTLPAVTLHIDVPSAIAIKDLEATVMVIYKMSDGSYEFHEIKITGNVGKSSYCSITTTSSLLAVSTTDTSGTDWSFGYHTSLGVTCHKNLGFIGYYGGAALSGLISPKAKYLGAEFLLGGTLVDKQTRYAGLKAYIDLGLGYGAFRVHPPSQTEPTDVNSVYGSLKTGVVITPNWPSLRGKLEFNIGAHMLVGPSIMGIGPNIGARYAF